MLAKQPCKITLTTDKTAHEYEVKGSNKTTRILTHDEGEMFQFSIEGDSADMHVSNVEIMLTVSK